jgi:hypothetical protein
MSTPQAAANKLILIDTFTAIYHKEFKLAKIAVIFLLFSIVLFILGLMTFTFQVI